MKNKTFRCHKCGHDFTFAWNLKQHLKHSRFCGSSEEEFRCANCKKTFTLNATLKHHFARCIAVDPHRFSCTHCPRKFTFKSSLHKHLRGRRCPNISYDSKQINDSDFEFVEFQELEEVCIDEIEFKKDEIKNVHTNHRLKNEEALIQSDGVDEEYLSCDLQEANVGVKIESCEFKYIYDNCSTSHLNKKTV